jgi:hypothetical protein
MNHARRVDIAFAVGIHAADDPFGADDRSPLPDLVDADQLDIVDAHRLEDTIGSLQPFPALGRAGDAEPAGHVHPDALAGFPLDLGQEVDRIGLEGGDVRVGVQGMEAAGGVPARPRGQDLAFEKSHIRPSELGEMIGDRCADDATADDDRAII